MKSNLSFFRMLLAIVCMVFGCSATLLPMVVENDTDKKKQNRSDSIEITADYSYTVSGFTVFYESPLICDSLSYIWDFGDGTVVYDKPANHTYATMGYYETCLTIVAPISKTVVHKKCQFIEILDPNLCDTNWNPVCGCDNQTYMNACFASNYHGVYYWTPGVCSEIDFSLLADFHYNVVGNQVQFMNTSEGNFDSYIWDFGDDITSEQRNPNYSYKLDGVYQVCLTVSSMITKQKETYCEDVTIDIPIIKKD